MELIPWEHLNQVTEERGQGAVEIGVDGVQDSADAAAATGPVLVGAQNKFALRECESGFKVILFYIFASIISCIKVGGSFHGVSKYI